MINFNIVYSTFYSILYLREHNPANQSYIILGDDFYDQTWIMCQIGIKWDIIRIKQYSLLHKCNCSVLYLTCSC